MSHPDQDTQAGSIEVESVRFLQKEGGDKATLSVVVGGVHYLWKCKRVNMLVCAESIFAAVRKQELADLP